MENQGKRKIIAVIGSAGASKPQSEVAFSIGKALIDGGYRIANGGMYGVMESSAKGARSSSKYVEGDILVWRLIS